MIKNLEKPHLPIHTLIGPTEENFYQLGLNDRERHSLLINHAIGLIRATRSDSVNKGIQSLLKSSVGFACEYKPRFKKRMQAYAEGLETSLESVTTGLLIPEIMSCLDKWFPGIPSTILGCSSYFTWDEKRDSMVHGRTLDFPFLGSFDANERILKARFDHGPLTLSFSSAGFPYPSITVMSEAGFSLALHQKFSRTFNYTGTPIFDLIFELLQNCQSQKDIIQFLKKSESLTAWALYIGFADGKVLSSEIDGKDLYYNEHQTIPGKVLYFCNERENPDLVDPETMPYGFQLYNEMRQEQKEKKLEELGLSQTNWTAEKLIRYMGVALEQKDLKSRDWKADPMTPATLQNICMLPGKSEALLIGGSAPKFFAGDVVKISDCFKKEKSKNVKVKGKSNSSDYRKGVHHLMQSQVNLDLGKTHNAFHHIQIAREFLENYPYGKIVEFFFYVLQYMYENDRKVLGNLLVKFKGLEDLLPSYLQDHNTLFIARLESILKGRTTVGIDEIHHMALQKVFEFEKRIPRTVLHLVTREVMNPRFDILDIIYPHVRP